MKIPNLSRRSAAGTIACLMLLPMLVALPASALADHVVNSTADLVDAAPGDGICSTGGVVGLDPECTIRAAVQEANATPGTAEVVEIPTGTFAITIAGRAEDAAATGDWDVTAPLTIMGAGPGSTFLDGATLDRVLDIHGDIVVEISGVTIRGGDAAATTSTSGGGGLRNLGGTVTVRDATITTSTAGTVGGPHGCCGGGGVANINGDLTLDVVEVSENVAPFGFGAGIHSTGGSLTLLDSTVADNIAEGCCGGGVRLDGTATITRSTITRNRAEGGSGGGILQDGGTLDITDSSVSENWTTYGGGGIEQDAGELTLLRSAVDRNTAYEGGGGGIIAFDRLTLVESSVDGNTARWDGAAGISAWYALTVIDSSVDDNVMVDGWNGVGIIFRGSEEPGMTILRSSVSQNVAASGDANGGGVQIWGGRGTIASSVIEGNSVGNSMWSWGGGIWNRDTLEILDSSVSGNTAGDQGGGIYNTGLLTIAESSVVGNSLISDPPAGSETRLGGGGLFTYGYATITNSTLSGNDSADLPGSAVHSSPLGAGDDPVLLDSVTVLGGQGPAALHHGADGANGLVLANTIVVAGDADSACAGTITSLGHNLASDASCTFGDATDLLSADPLLATLAGNGGVGDSHLLLDGSPAIDSGPAGACPATDQRGVVRPVDGDDDGTATCDRGAIEVAFGEGGDGGDGGDGGGGGDPPAATASLEIASHAATGEPVVARVDVYDQATGRFLATTFTRSDGTAPVISGIADGATLELRATKVLSPVPVTATTTLEVDVAEGTNPAPIVFPTVDTGTVTGVVQVDDGTGPRPATGAFVSATQLEGPYAGRHVSTRTGSDGSYSLPVLEGGAAIAFSYLDWPSQHRDVVVPAGGSTTADSTLSPRRSYSLSVDLFTQYVDGPLNGPLVVNQRVWNRYDLALTTPTGEVSSAASPVLVRGAPGETVRLCADGAVDGLPEACGSVELGDDLTPRIRLDMEQVAALDGQLLDAAGEPLTTSSTVSLLRDHASGRNELVASFAHRGGPFLVSVPEPGDYVVEASDASTRWRSAGVTVAAGQRIDLGALSPWTGAFGGTGNGVTVMRPTVLPGQDTEVRVAWRVESDAVDDATMRLVLPEEADLLPGSVLLDGQVTVADVVDGNLDVDLGDLADGTTGTLRVRLRVPGDSSAEQFVVSARMRHAGSPDVGDPLGAALVTIPRVTLAAPHDTDTLAVPVSGRAPAGATVTMYDGVLVLGEATATPGGYWSATVLLPDLGEGSWHGLQASITVDDVTLWSDRRGVQFTSDPDPRVTRVQLFHLLSSYDFDPTFGLARFPFVVIPGAPMRAELTFDQPDRVENVWVQIGEQTARATRQGDLWIAETIADGKAGMSTQFDVLPSGRILDPPPPPASLDHFRSTLPGSYADFEVTDFQAPNDDGTGTTGVEIDLPSLGPDAHVSAEIIVDEETNDYEPTAIDLEFIAMLGVEIYDAEIDFVPAPDGGELVITGRVPVSTVSPTGATASGTGLDSRVLAGQVGGLATQSLKVTLAMGGADAADAGAEYFDTNFSSLADMRTRLENSDLPAEQYNQLVNRVHDLEVLMQAKLGVDIALTIVGAASVALGPVGAIGGFVVTWAVGEVFDAGIDDIFDTVKAELIAALQAPFGDVQIELAEIVWIFDPSGFVYEGVESNRVPGVTATALAGDNAEGPFAFWDADWYGQVNPLVTDGKGRYAWDVPEGFWQVAFHKEGCDRAWSDVVEVLPPQVDVNVGLVCRAEPGIAEAAGQPDLVTVTFDRYVLPATGIAAMTLSNGATAVEGSVVALDTEADPDGRDLASSFGFVPAIPLSLGEVVTVALAPGVETYAGTVLTTELTVEVTIEEPVDPVEPNDPPVTAPDAYATTTGVPLDIGAADGVLANDTDPDGDVLVARPAEGGGPAHGALSLAPDGSFSYIPDAGWTGTDGFVYVADDGRGGEATGSVLLTVGPAPPRNALADLADRLAALDATGKAEKRLDKASSTLVDSDAGWWFDDATLDPKKGSKAFKAWSKVAAELQKALRVVTDPATRQEIESVMDELAQFARNQAATLLILATSTPEGAASRELDRAAGHLADGDGERLIGDLGAAIQSYGRSWEDTTKFMKRH